MPFGNPLGYTNPLSGASSMQPAFGGSTPSPQPTAPPAVARQQPSQAPPMQQPIAAVPPVPGFQPLPPAAPPAPAPAAQVLAGKGQVTRFAPPTRAAAPARPVLPASASPVAGQVQVGMRGLDLAGFAQQLRSMWGGIR